jgi:hypothetical protein
MNMARVLGKEFLGIAAVLVLAAVALIWLMFTTAPTTGNAPAVYAQTQVVALPAVQTPSIALPSLKWVNTPADDLAPSSVEAAERINALQMRQRRLDWEHSYRALQQGQ